MKEWNCHWNWTSWKTDWKEMRCPSIEQKNVESTYCQLQGTRKQHQELIRILCLLLVVYRQESHQTKALTTQLLDKHCKVWGKNLLSDVSSHQWFKVSQPFHSSQPNIQVGRSQKYYTGKTWVWVIKKYLNISQKCETVTQRANTPSCIRSSTVAKSGEILVLLHWRYHIWRYTFQKDIS